MKKSEFLISKYETLSSVLSRIKQDEQKWISNLLIIYGALFAFQVNKFSNAIAFGTDDKFNALGVFIIFFVNALISFIWSHQSLILRKQYYRTMLEIAQTKLNVGDKIEDDWFTEDFNKWREKITKPNEGKIFDFWLLSGLITISGLLAVLRLEIHTIHFLQIIVRFYCLIPFLLLGLLLPLIIYPFKDNKNLYDIFKTKKLIKKRH